ncbi:MAG: tRNA (adenosine(37)-N6)-dimethylallyltransferase MiaA [Rhodomicrobium sp.]
MAGTSKGAVLICGPTASGKSALALELAREFGGVVVNADSMQVYAELRVITNRPTPEEEAAAPHRLYGIRPAREPYSAALWLADVKAVLAEAERQSWLPIVAGGTGLYFKALTEGLSDIPDIPPEIRARYRQAAQIQPAGELHAELARRDPLTAARLRPSDPQRIVRALEVLEATGRPLAHWQGRREPPLLPLSQAYPIAMTPGRDELYRRCDARFDAMIAAGAVEEARAIAALGLDPSLPAMRAVGLPPLIAYVRGELSLEEAAAAAKTSTRNYAKRQLTWIRGNFSSWNCVSAQSSERTRHELNIFLRNRLT